MWMNSSRPDQHDGLSPPEKQGWMKEGNEWKIDCMGGRRSTTGYTDNTGCKTRLFSCRKGDRLCGVGCECRGCINSIATQAEEDNELEVENEEEDEEDDEPEEIENEEEDEDQEFDEEEEHIQLEIATDSFDDEVYMYFSHMI